MPDPNPAYEKEIVFAIVTKAGHYVLQKGANYTLKEVHECLDRGKPFWCESGPGLPRNDKVTQVWIGSTSIVSMIGKFVDPMKVEVH